MIDDFLQRTLDFLLKKFQVADWTGTVYGDKRNYSK